jgi:cytochrome c5
MSRMIRARATALGVARPAVLLALLLVLSGCTLGETMMPNPPSGQMADRSPGVVAPVPNPIPHSLVGRDECFTCHATGAVDAPAVPADHPQDVTQCTTCHAVWMQPGIAASSPPAIPHDLRGRQDCLMCHKLGTAGAPRIPDNHADLASDICQTCHLPQGEIAGMEEGTVVPLADIPSIPHGLEGFRACTLCHESGVSGAPQFPANHQGRTDDLCTACHEFATETSEATSTPATAAATTTPLPPVAAGDAENGQALFEAQCAVCHGASGEGTSIAPDPLRDSDAVADLSDDEVRAVLREGIDGKMPPQSNLTEQEVLDLIALLRSW